MAKRNRELTHLESIAMGIVWKFEGCTAYEVMSEFSGSLTSQFKSRAGSIYPLMKRLRAEKLLQQKVAKRGQQRKVVYRITATGKKALIRWLTPPLTAGEFALSTDPIRARVYFLGILPRQERLQFLEDALKQLRTELRKIEKSAKEYTESENEFGALAMKGAVYVGRARVRWLTEIIQLV